MHLNKRGEKNYMDYIITRVGSGDELYHYGVPGMKWGHRKSQYYQTVGNQRRISAVSPKINKTGIRSSKASVSQNSKTQKTELTSQQKAARRKKALKVGAAVAGTALAAYGTYKLAKFAQDKRHQAAMAKASDYIDKNFLHKVGESNFADGKTITNYVNKSGTRIDIGSRGSKAIGQHNAKVVATGRQIYKDSTNTRLDKGLSKIVGAGDSVGNATKRAAATSRNAVKRTGTTIKRAGTTAKNRVADVVNPIYTYEPGQTTVNKRNINGMNITETVTGYQRRKVRR